ncbi:hypothetical protein GGTG_00403 [Gaeumannomyces tritici R3-111a-1]|uniref:Uncharacterized protein n=1 Tax=Gaeumannomyces tritici (strain R3-111a-1) TaxID=644352 RepID=J3NGL4_GAET3|nr:hypothetical protein GGTG_00403 [Gaeumannomyces tritici R3-111a-1]EJT80404.1 hypothetical protein GGTG_00403 [Gaeumannomyces tritici R3-111a-1]
MRPRQGPIAGSPCVLFVLSSIKKRPPGARPPQHWTCPRACRHRFLPSLQFPVVPVVPVVHPKVWGAPYNASLCPALLGAKYRAPITAKLAHHPPSVSPALCAVAKTRQGSNAARVRSLGLMLVACFSHTPPPLLAAGPSPRSLQRLQKRASSCCTNPAASLQPALHTALSPNSGCSGSGHVGSVLALVLAWDTASVPFLSWAAVWFETRLESRDGHSHRARAGMASPPAKRGKARPVTAASRLRDNKEQSGGDDHLPTAEAAAAAAAAGSPSRAPAGCIVHAAGLALLSATICMLSLSTAHCVVR